MLLNFSYVYSGNLATLAYARDTGLIRPDDIYVKVTVKLAHHILPHENNMRVIVKLQELFQ